MTLSDVLDKWDEWLNSSGDEEAIRAWTAAKEVCDDPTLLDRWGTIIELNRLTKLGLRGTINYVTGTTRTDTAN